MADPIQKHFDSVDRQVRRTLRRYGRKAVSAARRATPTKTGATAKQWAYKMTGMPHPTLTVYLRTQRAQQLYEYATGRQYGRTIITEGVMVFTPAGGNTQAQSTRKNKSAQVFTHIVRRKRRPRDKSVDKAVEPVLKEAIREVRRITRRAFPKGTVRLSRNTEYRAW